MVQPHVGGGGGDFHISGWSGRGEEGAAQRGGHRGEAQQRYQLLSKGEFMDELITQPASIARK